MRGGSVDYRALLDGYSAIVDCPPFSRSSNIASTMF